MSNNDNVDFKIEMRKIAEIAEKEDEKKVLKILSERSLVGKTMIFETKQQAKLVKGVLERNYGITINTFEIISNNTPSSVASSMIYQLEFEKNIYDILNPPQSIHLKKKEIPFAVVVEHNGGNKSLCEKEDLTP
jgi:hypothetical protein